jgi:hypothetical protein
MVPSGPQAMRSKHWPLGSGSGMLSSTLGSSCRVEHV